MHTQATMAKRTSKGRLDMNELAASIVAQATGDSERVPDTPQKNPAAVSLGRLVGLKDGLARAKGLSAERRTEIARKAAFARWAK